MMRQFTPYTRYVTRVNPSSLYAHICCSVAHITVMYSLYGPCGVAYSKLTSFLVQIPFRRVGRTSFVAFSVDPRHPSRRLSVENDVHEHITPDYPPTPSGEGDDDEIHVLQLLIRTAGTNSFMNASAMDRIIRESYATFPVVVNWKDELGCKPLHVAARFCNLTAVRTLLSLLPEPVILQQLADRDNREGLTPLESCERAQRSARERKETSSFWTGYGDDALRIIYLLRRATGEDPDRKSTRLNSSHSGESRMPSSA